MKRFMLLGLAVAACAGTSSDGTVYYDNNDLELATGNGALMACSCMFTMEMPETYCRAWVKASPDVARIDINTVSKTVTASAFLSWGAKAHWVNEKLGCVLE